LEEWVRGLNQSFAK